MSNESTEFIRNVSSIDVFSVALLTNAEFLLSMWSLLLSGAFYWLRRDRDGMLVFEEIGGSALYFFEADYCSGLVWAASVGFSVMYLYGSVS